MRTTTVPTPPYQTIVGDWLQAIWQFINIEVYNLSALSIVASDHLGLLPLVPFMRESGLTVVEAAARTVKEKSAPREASELASLLAVFGARQFGNDAMRALIRRLFMSTEILDQSPLYREWVDKAKAEGKAEGEAEAMRDSVRTVLEGRFGTLDAELLLALEVATPDALRDVLRHITRDTLEQIVERLRQTAP